MSNSFGELQGNVQSEVPASFDSTQKLIAAIINNRLGSGFVGKFLAGVIVINPTLCTIACKLSQVSPTCSSAIGLLLALLDVLAVILVAVYGFKHPCTAVMDGTEIIIYKRQQKMDVLEPPVVEPVTYLELE